MPDPGLGVFHQLTTAEYGTPGQARASKGHTRKAQGLGLGIDERRG